MAEEPAAKDVSLAGGASEADVPAGYKRTEAGVIPKDWQVASLGTTADIRNGATPSTRNAANWNGSIPWCTPTDITSTQGKYLTETERRITEQGLAGCGASLLPAGALLLCSRATIGEIKIASSPVCTNQGFKSLVCTDRVHNEFLYYLLLTLKPKLIRQAVGSTFLEISKYALAATQVPFPTLKEQYAIAEALSDVDWLLESLEALITKRRAVKTAAMQQLLTGRTRLPGFSGEWKRTTMRNVGSIYGGLSGKTQTDFGRGNAKYVTFMDVLYNVIIGSCSVADVFVGSDENQNRVIAGDLLFNSTSETPGDLAMGAVVLVDMPDLYLNSFCFGLQVSSSYYPLFIAYLFRGPTGRSLIRALAQGATRYNISKRQFLDLEIRIPAYSEQRAIADVLSGMDAEIAAIERRLAKVRAFKLGVMQQLLTGRIRLVTADAIPRRIQRTAENGRGPAGSVGPDLALSADRIPSAASR